MEKWKKSDISDMDYVGLMEFQSFSDGEYYNFEILKVGKGDKSRFVFGSVCNIGFLESGYFKMDDYFSLDENLQELLEDFQVFYSEGRDFVSERFICNERM